jgi:hypothetical protein
VLTTSGAYPWSIVTQIFHSGQPSHGGDRRIFDVMTTLPKGTLGSIASRFFPHSRIITGFVTRLTWRMPLVEQELLTLPEHLRSPQIFSGVRASSVCNWQKSWTINHYTCTCTTPFEKIESMSAKISHVNLTTILFISILPSCEVLSSFGIHRRRP